MISHAKWMLATLVFGWGSVAPMVAEDAVAAPVAAVEAYPKPPRAMAVDGSLFLGYYARLWAKADYPGMYGALGSEAQEGCPFDKFAAALAEQRKVNGGVKSFSGVKEQRNDGYESEWSLTVNYVRSTATPLTIRVTLVKNIEAWEVKEGGLLPLDEAMIDR